MRAPKLKYVTDCTEVVYLSLDFTSNHDLWMEFLSFKYSNQIYNVRGPGGVSGQYKESYCYSKEDAYKIISWLQNR